MKRLRLVGLSIMVLSLTPLLASAQAPTYDAVRDWSIQSNPNGVWSYGYLTAWGAPFTLYTVEDQNNCWPGTSRWTITECTAPTVSHNDTSKTICGETWCFPPSDLGVHPGPNGELSIVRWTAPSSGKYSMRVRFQGIDWYFPTTTYVYVKLNTNTFLLKAPITSYEQPLTFNPPAIELRAGATLDFVVDWGKDKSYIGDSTGVEVKIWTVTP